jgi:hypothetical protein
MARFLFLLAGLVMLAAACWLGPSPGALARELSPAEMIESGLSGKKPIKSADKAELLSAVCGAVRKNRSAAPAITSAAVTAQPELASEIVASVLRCSGKINCEVVRSIVVAAASVDAASVAAIGKAAIAGAPNCVETIRSTTRRLAKNDVDGNGPDAASPTEQAPLIGTSAGADEGFDPLEELRLVCENGTPRAVRVSQLDDFLRTHPDSVIGPCPPQPSPSPILTATPSPATK